MNARRVLRSPREIRKMRRAGLLVWQAHQRGAALVQAGVTTAEINAVYRDLFAGQGATPLFLNYGQPPFPAETCISVNEELVHGIPGSRKLRAGDIVSIDTGCRLDGWCGDAAITLPVGEIPGRTRKLLRVTQGVLDLAIEKMAICQRWSDVAAAMQDYVRSAGFSVVEEMVGHGIGTELHEPPQVPNYLSDELQGTGDFELRPGVVLAVEPMVNAGSREIEHLADEWTVVTRDRQPCAHFEHTIAITSDGPQRLTGPPEGEEIEELPEFLQEPANWIHW